MSETTLTRKREHHFFRSGYLILVLLFIYLPIAYVMLFSFNDSKSMIKFSGFSLRWYEEMINNPDMLESLKYTVIIAVIATVCSTVIGTIAAIGISKARKLIRTIILEVNNLPVLNPDIVTAIGLMLLFLSLKVRRSIVTLTLAHITFCIPYVILSVMPKIAFSMSFDDFVISYFTAGMDVQNISMYVYSMKRFNPAVNALSAVIVIVVTVILVLANLIPYLRNKKMNKEEQ